MKDKELFFDFLANYIGFYEQIENQSRERFEYISANNLAGIERSIANDQSAILRAEQMEKKRIDLQEVAGYKSMSMREIIDTIEGEEKEKLSVIYSRLTELLESIQFYNARCTKIVKTNLLKMEKRLNQQVAPPVLTAEELQNIRLDGKA